MQAEEQKIQITNTKNKINHVLVKNWQQFTDRAMDLLVQNPTISKFVMKYIPKTQKFVLKVTNGYRIVMKKCSSQQFQQIERFTILAGRAFTNEGNKKVEQSVVQDKDKKKKKNKKR